MRKYALGCAVALLFAAGAAAQNDGSAGSAASPVRSNSVGLASTEPHWDIAYGYQFQRYDMSGVNVNQRWGSNAALTHFITGRLAIEAEATTGFSHSPTFVDYHTVMADGGVKYMLHRFGKTRVWVHGLAGLSYARQAQTSKGYGMVGGGGFDTPLFLRFSARTQVDWVETHNFGAFQRSIAVSGGLVMHF